MAGQILTGNPANVTTPLVATITSLANNGSGSIRATTGSPHLFGPNDWINVSTAVVAGVFQIAVIDATHFDLQGSTFTSTSTGTATDQSFTPQIQVPADGDTFSAQLSGLTSSQQAILDRTQALAARIPPGASTVGQWEVGLINDDVGPSYAAWGTATGSSLVTWHPILAPSSPLTFTITGLLSGDVVFLDFTTSVQQNFNANALVAFWAQTVPAGGALSAPTRVSASGQVAAPWSGTNPTPLHLHGALQLSTFGGAAILGGTLIVQPQVAIPTTSSDVVTFYSDALFTARVIRGAL